MFFVPQAKELMEKVAASNNSKNSLKNFESGARTRLDVNRRRKRNLDKERRTRSSCSVPGWVITFEA